MNSEKIIDYIIKNHYADLDVSSNVNYEVLAVYKRQLSCVIKVKLHDENSKQTVFVKVSKDHGYIMWGGCLAEEFRALNIIDSYNQGELHTELLAPKALLFIAEQHALVTKEIEGVDSSAILKKSMSFPYFSYRQQQAKKIVHGSGKWLKKFHQITPTQRDNFNFSPAIEWVEVRLKLLLKNNGPKIDNEFCNKVIRKLTSLKDEISNQPILISGNHSDFCPHNILFNSNDQVAVIDFASYIEGPVLYDVLRFSNELDDIGYYFGSSSTFSHKLQKEFFSAYDIDIDYQTPLVKFILCQYKVAKLLNSLYLGIGFNHFWGNGKTPYLKNLNWIKNDFFDD